jgi:hypothetical protein
VVAPLDQTIFAAEDFAFEQRGEQAVTSLLGRTLPDGGGDTYYNLSSGDGPPVRGWIEGEGSILDPGGQATFRQTTSGLDGGLDIGNSYGGRIGAAFGYDSSSFSDSLGGAASQETYRVSAYASQSLGSVGFSGSVSYASGTEHTARPTGLAAASQSSRSSDDLTGAVQISAPFQVGQVKLTPAAGAIVSGLSDGAFAETNAVNTGFAVNGGAFSVVDWAPFAQVALSRAFKSGSGLVVTPDVVVGYRYDSAPAGSSLILAAQDGTQFTNNGLSLDHSSAVLGASVTAHKGSWTAYVKYRANVAGNWNDQSLSAGIRVAF